MRLLVGLLCALLVPGPSLGQSNPVTNGGFEQIDPRTGFAVDWSPVGTSVRVVSEARSGQRALLLERGTGPGVPPEVGLNREWSPNSGQQGAMLGQLSGGILYRYKLLRAAPDANISFQIIPMSGRAYEDTKAGRVIRKVPTAHAGDGLWHEVRVRYDFTKTPDVKWVHVAVRLTGGPGALLVDDIEYVESVGPLLTLEKLHFTLDSSRSGPGGTLNVSVVNEGDQPAEKVTVEMAPPPGWRVLQAPATTLETLGPDAAHVLKWRIAGSLQPGEVRLTARAREVEASAVLRLAPRVELESLLASPPVAVPGAPVTIRATLRNRGTAVARGVVLRSGNREIRLDVPIGVAAASWSVRAQAQPGAQTVRCRLVGAQSEENTSASFLVTHAMKAPARPVVPGLKIRTGSDRTVAELTSGSRQVALLPHLGQVVFRLPDGRVQTLAARYMGSGPRLRSVQTDTAGGRWTFEATAAPARGAVRLRIAVSCDKPRSVLRFEGPMLLAHAGLPSAYRRDGLFPGLEWLVPGEVSSSDLDIGTNHPDRKRYVPHPNKVTIPAIAVTSGEHTVALLWDAAARWDGVRDRPQPVFASPDRLLGAAAHRMGLIAPNVPAGLPENGLEHPRGHALRPGSSLTLEATLAVVPKSSTPLDGVKAWFAHYRPQPVLPGPQRNDRQWLAWTMEPYLTTLWVGPDKGWLPFLGGPPIWRNPSFDRTYAFDLARVAAYLPNHPKAPAWRARLQEVAGRFPAPEADDIGMYFADPVSAVSGMAARAAMLVAGQRPGGEWVFDANRRDQGVFRGMDYHELGPDGAAEVGTIARHAYELLRHARISGDAQAFQAGVRALNAMRRFTVPRAAQVWEVPLHTPDILAAADAVDAYLEAHRYALRANAREQKTPWLEQAKYWALAGLPFVYVWSEAGKPWMRYGSIPVFGATWYEGSWFGNLVQWNGLRYAYAIRKLHAYDPNTRFGGLTWHDLAVGITRSAMYQQSTKKQTYGLWPDALHTITLARADWEFAPRLIVKNVFQYMGMDEEPGTLNWPMAGGVVRISSTAPLRVGRAAQGVLACTLQPGQGQSLRLLVAGIGKPTVVRAGSVALQEGWSARGGWRYDPLGLLAVQLPPARAKGPVSVTLEGVTVRQPQWLPRPTSRLHFTFDRGDEEGWIGAHDIGEVRVRDGVLIARTDGSDPWLERTACRIAPGLATIRFRMRARGSDGVGQLFWSTSDSPSWDEQKSLRFTFRADGEWQEVVLPVGEHAQWHGKTITGLRLDPGSRAGAIIELDWIRGE